MYTVHNDTTEATLSNVAKHFASITINAFTLFPKATSVMWSPFIDKRGGLIRWVLLYMLYTSQVIKSIQRQLL